MNKFYPFKVLDRVFHISEGWGTVKSIDDSIEILFDNGKDMYVNNSSLLSFTEYTLTKTFSQDRSDAFAPKKFSDLSTLFEYRYAIKQMDIDVNVNRTIMTLYLIDI